MLTSYGRVTHYAVMVLSQSRTVNKPLGLVIACTMFVRQLAV